jgi:hypothetical protein
VPVQLADLRGCLKLDWIYQDNLAYFFQGERKKGENDNSVVNQK